MVKGFGLVVLVWGIGVCGLALAGQTLVSQQAEDWHGLKVRDISPKATPTPFPLGARTETISQLTFLAPEAMSAGDKALVENNAEEIARRAEIVGFRLESGAGDGDGGGWGYEQAVCPAFPEHLLLEYSRMNPAVNGPDGARGRGDVSLFSVVIPRGEGHVRVIPAQRRSYSLYTPVSKNELTINDFNHMVKEEGGLNPDWLGLGLCYTAMASGHVRAALVPLTREDEVYPLSMAAKLTVSRYGGAEVRFADKTPTAKRMDWVMKFSQDGRLLKVRHFSSDLLTARPVADAVQKKGVPVRGAVVDVP